MVHPVVSKAAANEYTEKPFIELSIYEAKTAQANIRQFKYFKLLVQEFAIKLDQGLIFALIEFIRAESVRLIILLFFYYSISFLFFFK